MAARPDFLQWFEEWELDDCPRCGRHSIVTTHTGATVCTECGYLGFHTAPTAAPDPPSA